MKTGNGESDGVSEGNKAKAGTLKAIESGNNEVILSSQSYSSESAAEEGSGAVQRADATIDDQTGIVDKTSG